MSLSQDYDVVVVGSGIAGCMVAQTIAKLGKGNVSVLLTDRNPQTDVGKKNTLGWVCGDAVGEHHVNYVKKKLGIEYSQPEMENHVEAVYVYSPDRQVEVPFEGPGFVLDRPKFARRLLEQALTSQIDFLGNVQADEVWAEDGFVKGVVLRDLATQTHKKISSKLVIDCSGMSTKLRRNLPVKSYMEKEIDKDDVEPTARINGVLGDDVEVGADRCYIYLDQVQAPGGYLWVFPKSSKKVNVGLGIQQKRTRKSLSQVFKDWLANEPLLRGLSPLSDDSNLTGAWQVSVRHQNDSLVANGYMICGDAAWFPNPISAGGIGPGLIGGVIAGEVAVGSVESGDLSEEQLWPYNTGFVDMYGKKTAALEAFRVYLQSLNNDEIDYGMRYFLSKEEAVEMSLGDLPHLSLGDKIGKLFRGLRRFKAFRGLVYTFGRMKELNHLYENYPASPSAFPSWKARVDGILDEVRSRFN